MKKIAKNILMITGGFAAGLLIGSKVTSKIISTYYESDLDDVEYVKTPNDHIIIKIDEPGLEKNDADSEIDVSINEIERKPFDASDENRTI